MSKNTAWGNKAYNETRRSGGSKEQAREASSKASEAFHKHIQANQFERRGSYVNDVSDFNNSINDGSWHTADDL